MFSAVIGIRLCSVKFHRARLSALRQVLSCLCAMMHRVGKYWISLKICHHAFGCARSNSIASCVFICARSNSFVCARNAASFCWVSDSSVKRWKSSDVFSRSRKLERGQNFLIPHENLKRTKRFNSWSFGSTPWWLKRTPSEWLHNPCIGELGAPPQYRTQDSIVDVNI